MKKQRLPWIEGRKPVTAPILSVKELAAIDAATQADRFRYTNVKNTKRYQTADEEQRKGMRRAQHDRRLRYIQAAWDSETNPD